MTTADLDSRIRAAFAKILHVDPASLKDDTRRGELEAWDSMAHLDLVAELETQLSVQIEPDDALAIETFGDARQVVGRLVADA